jgi:hypothetical protein
MHSSLSVPAQEHSARNDEGWIWARLAAWIPDTRSWYRRRIAGREAGHQRAIKCLVSAVRVSLVANRARAMKFQGAALWPCAFIWLRLIHSPPANCVRCRLASNARFAASHFISSQLLGRLLVSALDVGPHSRGRAL